MRAYHPNGMTFFALNGSGAVIRERTYYSVGGGFVVNEEAAGADRIVEDNTHLPFHFTTGAGLLALCEEQGLSVSQIMLHNQRTGHRDE